MEKKMDMKWKLGNIQELLGVYIGFASLRPPDALRLAMLNPWIDSPSAPHYLVPLKPQP